MLRPRKLYLLQFIFSGTLLLFSASLMLEAGFIQEKAKKKRVEEEDDERSQKGQAKSSQKRTEEEDTEENKTASKLQKKRVEEEDDRSGKSDIRRLDEEIDKPTTVASADLSVAAKQATHPRLKALFHDLSIPHDLIHVKGFGSTVEGGRVPNRVLWVSPLAEYIPEIDKHTDVLTLNVLDRDTGKSLRIDKIPPSHITSIRWFEQVAADEVQSFLAAKFAEVDPSHPTYLNRFDQLTYAEQALSAVVSFHRSARDRGVRRGAGWEEIGHQLDSARLAVQLQRVEQLAEARSWDTAFTEMKRLVDTYSRQADRKQIARSLTDLLARALKDSNYARERPEQARAHLAFIEEQFPGSNVGAPIRSSLIAEAKSLFDQAMSLKATQPDRAVELFKAAEQIWPALPNLRNERIQVDREYQILNVGMRELPRFLSPSWACTDAELRAVELLFESLVAPTVMSEGLLSYRPALAAAAPEVIPRGRQFQLPRQARWSNGSPLRADDLRATLRLLRDETRLSERNPAWGELLENRLDAGLDGRIRLRLRQGLLDPLGALSFKILPRNPDPTTQAFAESPLGSGPFVYAGQKSDGQRTYASFRANDHYGIREEKRDTPRIREIRFFAVSDPVADLRQGNLQVALDLRAEQVEQLRANGQIVTSLSTPPLPNRRVWFLAVNHRQVALAEPDIRIALARAIPREQLLNEHFRKGLGAQVHKALNGPYPAGSWACDPELVSRTIPDSLDAYDPGLARARAEQGLQKLRTKSLTLTIKYPSGDPDLEAAMESLCRQAMTALPGITLKAEARSPHQLRTEVEETQNYELAYYPYDFLDETLWLYPLLGPHGRNGRDNYLGFTGSLVTDVQATLSRRSFVEVRKDAHQIHRKWLERDMPTIPLWQLDPLYAYDGRRMDFDGASNPLPWFQEVERWRVRPK